MKQFMPFILLTTITLASCQKDLISSKTTGAKDQFAIGAVKYLKMQISEKEFRGLDLRSLYLMSMDGKTIALKIAEKDTANHKTVYIGKGNTGYFGNWVTCFFDKTSGNGLLVTETFDGRIKKEVTFENNVPAKLVKTINGVSKTFEPVYRKDLEDTTSSSVMTH